MELEHTLGGYLAPPPLVADPFAPSRECASRFLHTDASRGDPFNSEAEMKETEQNLYWYEEEGLIIIPCSMPPAEVDTRLTLPDILAMLDALSPKEREGETP